MGVNHLVCNLAKREYFAMWTFGEDDRFPATLGYAAHRLLHTYAITCLCAGGRAPSDYHTRWYGDPVEIVSDFDDDRNELILDTYTDISLPLLDDLCEDNEDFFDEILRRGLEDCRWDLPVTTALLTLLDDARYETLRYWSHSYLERRADVDGEEPAGEERWMNMVGALRAHYDRHFRLKLKREPPTDAWAKTFDWNHPPELRRRGPC